MEATLPADYEYVKNPKHYNTHPSGVEAIEVCRLLDFNLGNAFKYVMRRGDKGSFQQDLDKANWYLVDELNHLDDTPSVAKLGKAIDLMIKVIDAEPNEVAHKFYTSMLLYLEANNKVYKKFYLKRMMARVKNLKEG
jgi:hypothetical protein